jgi:hypothetical protein
MICNKNNKKEFGDFQTPLALAIRATALVSELYGVPGLVVEPTCGVGAFLCAATEQWGDAAHYVGYEINAEYIQQAQRTIQLHTITFHHRDFFSENWRENLHSERENILILGNPPWVTNSALSQLGSQNFPKKTNFQGMRGLDARTGKANFDIAEWIILQLLDALPADGTLAMLCKTMTARKVLRHIWRTRGGLEDSRLFRIDARAAFDVAVDACLFTTSVRPSNERIATIYSDLDLRTKEKTFGFVYGDLVSDLDAYCRHEYLDGGTSIYTWRSGVKHDASSVMEFTREDDFYRNGLNEKVRLEEKFIYPLLKSSDLGNGRAEARKYVLIPQMHTGDDTANIKNDAPQTWDYLIRHEEIFARRQSSIYRNRPPFSVFGIGAYSFAPWKVAISGLYKTFSFIVVPPVNGRPVMLDDTCYALSCRTEEEARLLGELLNSTPAIEFLCSLVFTDSKRPITVDVLRRISILALAQRLGKVVKYSSVASTVTNATNDPQLFLLMENIKTQEATSTLSH